MYTLRLYVYLYAEAAYTRIYCLPICPICPKFRPALAHELLLVLGPLAELSPRDGGAQVPRVSGGGRLLVGAHRVGRRR